MNPQSILNDLKTDGVRLTKARKMIIQDFLSSKRPKKASDILASINTSDQKVNKTTVYRELNFLLNRGLIQEIYIDPKRIYYETSFLKHHHHFICKNCGHIEDVALEKDLNEFEKKLEGEKKFKIEKHSLEFFGLCQNCH